MLLIWEAFSSKEEWRFPFFNIILRFRGIYTFVLYKLGKWWHNQRRFHNNIHSIKNISRNIKSMFFKLSTRNVYHKRNKKKHSLCCCHDNSYATGPVFKCYFKKNRIFSIETILKHKQVVCMRRKMLFTILKYLFSFQRYSKF